MVATLFQLKEREIAIRTARENHINRFPKIELHFCGAEQRVDENISILI